MMKTKTLLTGLLLLLTSVGTAWADSYSDALKIFKNAGESAGYFKNCYGYALFPTIGKAGVVVGGAHGSGQVYKGGKLVGKSTVTQLSIGFQLGGQAYSQIVFFKDKRAFDEFTSGEFEFGAGVGVVAITAAANANASTTGSTAGVSGGSMNADTVTGGYKKGMAVFTVAKGGLMYEASVAGQKFTYKAL